MKIGKSDLNYGLGEMRRLYKVYNMVRELIQLSRVPKEERTDEWKSSRTELQERIEKECEYTVDIGFVQLGKSMGSMLRGGTMTVTDDKKNEAKD